MKHSHGVESSHYFAKDYDSGWWFRAKHILWTWASPVYYWRHRIKAYSTLKFWILPVLRAWNSNEHNSKCDPDFLLSVSSLSFTEYAYIFFILFYLLWWYKKPSFEMRGKGREREVSSAVLRYAYLLGWKAVNNGSWSVALVSSHCPPR